MKKKKPNKKAIAIRKKLNAFAAQKYRAAIKFRAAVNPVISAEDSNLLKKTKIKLQALPISKRRKLELESQKKIKEVLKSENEFRAKKHLAERKEERKSANKVIDEVKRGEKTMSIPYRPWERQSCIDYMLHHKITYYKDKSGKETKYQDSTRIKYTREPKIKIETFLGMSIKDNAAEVVSWIDKAFEGTDSDFEIIFFIKGTDVFDYDKLNSK